MRSENAFRIKTKYLWSAANRLLLYNLYRVKVRHKRLSESAQQSGSRSDGILYTPRFYVIEDNVYKYACVNVRL